MCRHGVTVRVVREIIGGPKAFGFLGGEISGDVVSGVHVVEVAVKL